MARLTQPTLRTQRLVLRPFREGDAPALHEFFSDPEATRFWDDPHETLDKSEAFVTGTINASPDRTCDFVIEKDGVPVGKAGMWEAPEIGFFVVPRLQQQGIAREALGAVIPHLFTTYAMPALTADVDPRNEASLRLLQSFGFEETHRAPQTIQIGGAWCDSIYMALPRP